MANISKLTSDTNAALRKIQGGMSKGGEFERILMKTKLVTQDLKEALEERDISDSDKKAIEKNLKAIQVVVEKADVLIDDIKFQAKGHFDFIEQGLSRV